jgi:hypothetical protein
MVEEKRHDQLAGYPDGVPPVEALGNRYVWVCV